MHPSFWAAFEKRADATSGYQESSDPAFNTDFLPNKDAVSPTRMWGVKIDYSPDEIDIAAGTPLSTGHPFLDTMAGRG